jgi:high-affinity iron transporter
MAASFFLTLREGLEVALILGILLGALRKIDREDLGGPIWAGAGAAVASSLVVGLILNYIGASLEGRAEEIFEGLAMILAAGFLTWTLLWMRSQSQAVSQKLAADAQGAVLKDNKTALFVLAFLSVFREGVELAIFLTAASMSIGNTNVLIGAAFGLAAVGVLAVLLFQSLIRLNISRFFQITSILLILFAAGLVAHGVHEFNEAGVIPSIIEHVWDINSILDENSTIGELLKVLAGYNGNPSLSEIIAYAGYLSLIFLLTRKKPVRIV